MQAVGMNWIWDKLAVTISVLTTNRVILGNVKIRSTNRIRVRWTMWQNNSIATSDILGICCWLPSSDSRSVVKISVANSKQSDTILEWWFDSRLIFANSSRHLLNIFTKNSKPKGTNQTWYEELRFLFWWDQWAIKLITITREERRAWWIHWLMNEAVTRSSGRSSL